MAKINLPTVTDSTQVSTINNNFQEIEDQLNSDVFYRTNPIGEPNQLSNDIDLNSNDILNAGATYTTTLYVNGTRVTVNELPATNSYVNLIDTEGTYSAKAGKFSRVNPTEDGLALLDVALTDATDFPANYAGAATKRLVVNGAGWADLEGVSKTVTLTSGVVSSITLMGIAKYKENDLFRVTVRGVGTATSIGVDVTQFLIGS